MTYPIRQISVSIERTAAEVYRFVANPENLPKWAGGLSQSTLEKEGDHWVADSPMGKVKVKFAETNAFGVLDHDVTLPDGEVNHNPLRVVPNQQGCEITFTLFHLPRMSEAEFEADAQQIEKDLKKLKSILE